MPVVVDASIVIKWLVDEDDSPLALALRAEHEVSAPDFVLIECRNVLLTKTRRKLLLGPAEAVRAESAIGIAELELLPSHGFLTQAFMLALELGQPIYDCIYLAAATVLDRQLVTADARFCKAAQRLPVARDRVVLLGSLGAT